MKGLEGQGEQKDFEVIFAIHLQCRNVSSNMGSFTILCDPGTGTSVVELQPEHSKAN